MHQPQTCSEPNAAKPSAAGNATITFGPRVRKSPFFEATRRWGCQAFSVYNHMYMPLYYADPVTDYGHLISTVTLWDVAVQRQVEITGPDAASLTQLLTPRNLSDCAVGQCKYAPITAEDGGMLNDPVLLKLADDHFWLSLADSDILLWAKAIAWRSGMNATLREPDVSPLQLQGPRSAAVMAALFGDDILNLRYFRCLETTLDGIPLVISRTGWSNELGYELYLRDGGRGDDLWERIMAAGAPFGIMPGAPSTIRRIEAGILSYGSDIGPDVNPFELGLGRLVDLDMDAEFIGKDALRRLALDGVRRRMTGFVLDPDAGLLANEHHWPLEHAGREIGKITSAVHSPRLQQTIALGFISTDAAANDVRIDVRTPMGMVEARTAALPFIEPPADLKARTLVVETPSPSVA
jgi:aminomethyltransferase